MTVAERGVPALLSIAGLDPTAGAGLLADLVVAREHDMRGVGIVTAQTVQDTHGVHLVMTTPVDVVAEQLVTLLSDVTIDAVKIGMVGDVPVAAAVAKRIAHLTVPIVWDPLLRPSHGEVSLFSGDPSEAAKLFLPLVTLVTPNLQEASVLTGAKVTSVAAMHEAANVLLGQGAAAVLIKGGHLEGGQAIDVLCTRDDVTAEFDEPKVACGEVHGAGCVLSSAIACELGKGASLELAVRRAKRYVTEKLRRPLAIGSGVPTLV